MLKIVFMGTPAIAKSILESLCQHGYHPALVVSQTAKVAGRGHKIQPSAVEQFAVAQQLKCLTTDNINLEPSLSELKKIEPDLILVAAFGQILREPILQLPKIACLNVHASLLPRLRGAAPIQRAIWEGDQKTGVTIQKMAKKLDTGDILLQKEITIWPKETSGQLMERLSVLGGEALLEAVRKIEEGNYAFTPQEEAKATYAAKLDKSDSKILWTKTAQEIERQIRALQPWPTAEIEWGDQKLKVFSAEVIQSEQKEIGSVETDSRTYLTVQCGSGSALQILEVQPENRKRMSMKDYLLGFRGNFPYRTVLH